MNSPTEEHKYLKNLKNIKQLAYFNIFEKYIKYNLKGSDKKFEIDSTDQESIINSKNGGLPVPGMIYTFLHQSPDVIIKMQKGNKSYSDLVPLVFCLQRDNRSFTGLNLNLLPPMERLAFIQAFYDTFKQFLEKEVDILTQNDKLALNKRFLSYLGSSDGLKMIAMFNKKTSANFNFAFRKYLFPNIKNLRLIEYAEWKYIPYYEAKDAFRKMNHSQLHQLYHDKNK